MVNPQLPTTSVVIPWRTVLWAPGLVWIDQSLWLWASTNPGQTRRPLASIVRAPDLGRELSRRGHRRDAVPRHRHVGRNRRPA